MRSSVAVPKAVADQGQVNRLLEILKKAGGPLMIKQVAEALSVSANTAGKYVDICQALGLVSVKPYATTKQVSLTPSGGKGGTGGR